MRNQPDYTPRTVTPRGNLAEDEQTTIRLFEAASPTVVWIHTQGYERIGPDAVAKRELTSGTGVIWDEDGRIITNLHVVEGSVFGGVGELEVELPNKQVLPVDFIGAVSSCDIAVLQIRAAPKELQPVTLGTSNDLKVGQRVFAIGSPFGMNQTLSSGIISGLDREVQGNSDVVLKRLIQTDAAINPGNSGGPLVNASGAVIGVNSAIASLGSSFGGQSGSIGLGFAIPINQAKRTAEQLIATGKSSHPILGISLDMNFAGPGAVIPNTRRSIIAAGPADKAGLQSGDVITYLDGEKIDNADELIVAIRSHAPGDKVEITFTRNGKSLKTSAILVAAPEN